MKYNLYFHCSENTAFYIFTAVKYSFFKICIIFNTYFPVFHYFVYNKYIYIGRSQYNISLPGQVAQSVTCLATDASLTADPGVASSIPARSHTFVEIDHEIISTVILLPSAESFKKGCCQLQAKVYARSTG